MNKGKHGSLFAAILQLGKIKISLPVALTGFLGYFRASPETDLPLLYTILGILFLSMGSSTFNQVQERNLDKQMHRTKDRPLPSGRITLKAALASGIILSLAGIFLLFLTGTWLAPLLGLITMAWYNGIYTPLKKRTPFAVLPGAIIGALPPLIGWAAAGGDLLSKEILLISFFLFIGQMPHYWLLLMKVGDEFSGAGLPVITRIFSREQLRNISFVWIFAAAVFVVSFPAFHIIETNWMAFFMIAVIILFLLRMFFLTYRGNIMEKWKSAFITVNLFYLFIIVLLIADKLSSHYL